MSYIVHGDAMKARLLLSRLANCQQTGARYLDAEMTAAQVKLELRPDFKEVMRDVAASCGEHMSEFARIAIQERMERLLGQRITESERLEREERALDAAAKKAEAA